MNEDTCNYQYIYWLNGLYLYLSLNDSQKLNEMWTGTSRELYTKPDNVSWFYYFPFQGWAGLSDQKASVNPMEPLLLDYTLWTDL